MLGIEMNEKLLPLIQKCMWEIGKEQEIELPRELSGDTALFGRDGLFDSLGLVSLVVAVEEAIEDQYGVSISLADQRAMSEKHSPFRSVGSLAEYAGRLIGERR